MTGNLDVFACFDDQRRDPRVECSNAGIAADCGGVALGIDGDPEKAEAFRGRRSNRVRVLAHAAGEDQYVEPF